MPTLPFVPGGLGKSARFYTLVGLVIGGLLWSLASLLARGYESTLVAVTVVLLWAVLTGGLHLDGFADCCDGLLASVSAEKRLEIMRDPRTGSFAVSGLILILLLKVIALRGVIDADKLLPAILLAPTLARWLILPTAKQRLARNEGLGAQFSAELTQTTLVVCALIPLALILYVGAQAVVALAASVSVAGLLVLLAIRRIGGVTGDVYGLVVESAEVAVLMTFAYVG